MTSPELEQILQILGSPSAPERIMDKLARAWAQGWTESQRHMMGDPKASPWNPYLPPPKIGHDT